MDGIVTLNELLNVSNSIKENADKHKEFNDLLEDVICNKYDTVYIKKELVDLFANFKSARYLYDFPIADTIKMTPIYERDESFHQRSNVSKVEQAVARCVDKQLLTTNVYYSIIKVSYKLTHDEVIYLLNTFLSHKSEEDIAEIIGTSKTSLQKVKKSCLVKLWVDLEQYCKKDD